MCMTTLVVELQRPATYNGAPWQTALLRTSAQGNGGAVGREPLLIWFAITTPSGEGPCITIVGSLRCCFWKELRQVSAGIRCCAGGRGTARPLPASIRSGSPGLTRSKRPHYCTIRGSSETA